MDLECIFAEAILERSGFSIFFFSTDPVTGGAGLSQETLTQPFTKCTGKRADELISASLTVHCVEIGSFAKFPDLV